MTESKRLLLVILEPKDKTRIILEFPDRNLLTEMQKQAESHGLECEEIPLEKYDRVTYRGCRYFDLRNTFTRKNFLLEDWLEFLNHWDEHERDNRHG
tara:strand:- start:2 stop:292 length:291 start_codon:yes stop_codon:yes gene_type:complete